LQRFKAQNLWNEGFAGSDGCKVLIAEISWWEILWSQKVEGVWAVLGLIGPMSGRDAACFRRPVFSSEFSVLSCISILTSQAELTCSDFSTGHWVWFVGVVGISTVSGA
jgi:hypothetical protein